MAQECCEVYRVHQDIVDAVRKSMPDTPWDELQSDMDTADRARRAYCEKMTGRAYGDCRNYDLTLCTSTLGFEKAYQLLKSAAEMME